MAADRFIAGPGRIQPSAVPNGGAALFREGRDVMGNVTTLDEASIQRIRTLLVMMAEQGRTELLGVGQLPSIGFGGSPAGARVATQRTGAVSTQGSAINEDLGQVTTLIQAFDDAAAELRLTDEYVAATVRAVASAVAGAVTGGGRVWAV